VVECGEHEASGLSVEFMCQMIGIASKPCSAHETKRVPKQNFNQVLLAVNHINTLKIANVSIVDATIFVRAKNENQISSTVDANIDTLGRQVYNVWLCFTANRA